MLFENFLIIPNQEFQIIELLIHIFINCLYLKKFNIKNIELIPNNEKKRIYFYKIEDNYIYSSLPPYWSYEIIENEENKTCPYYEQHSLIIFINNVLRSIQIRKTLLFYKKINNILENILKEINFDCEYCKNYNLQLKDYKDNYIYLFYNSIIENKEEMNDIKKVHEKNINVIKKQLRSEKLIYNIMYKLNEYLENYYEKFKNEPEKIYEIKLNLKNDIQMYIIKNIPFLKLTEINFMDWIDKLLLLKINLIEFENNNEITINYCKKIIFLLQILFLENIDKNINFIYLNNKQINKKYINIEKMYEYHPILRGEYLENLKIL
jgi:hypothetical protein